MQSESGIVPDFEVGEEFQEEPKTYYELKSTPLKNRSVCVAVDSYFPRWSGFCAQVIIRLRSVFALVRDPCACARGSSGDDSNLVELGPGAERRSAGFNWSLIPYGYPAGMKLCNTLGVVLSTSSPNISSRRSRQVRV